VIRYSRQTVNIMYYFICVFSEAVLPFIYMKNKLFKLLKLLLHYLSVTNKRNVSSCNPTFIHSRSMCMSSWKCLSSVSVHCTTNKLIFFHTNDEINLPPIFGVTAWIYGLELWWQHYKYYIREACLL